MEDILSNKGIMTKQRIKKVRKKRMRSYRKIMHFLWAFGITGLVLGIGIITWFGLKRHEAIMMLGVLYTLCSIILLGIRGILSHMDHGRKLRHNVYSGPTP